MPHDPARVVSCLVKHGVTAKIRPPQDLAGDFLAHVPIITAHLGTARAEISMWGEGSSMGNIATYSPDGKGAPRPLVEAVWACAGRANSTTPGICDVNGCRTYVEPY